MMSACLPSLVCLSLDEPPMLPPLRYFGSSYSFSLVTPLTLRSWAGSGCGSMVPLSTTIQALPSSPPAGHRNRRHSASGSFLFRKPLPPGTSRSDSLTKPASWSVRRREQVEQS